MDTDCQARLSIWPEASCPCVSEENACGRKTRRFLTMCLSPGMSACPRPLAPRTGHLLWFRWQPGHELSQGELSALTSAAPKEPSSQRRPSAPDRAGSWSHHGWSLVTDLVPERLLWLIVLEELLRKFKFLRTLPLPQPRRTLPLQHRPLVVVSII